MMASALLRAGEVLGDDWAREHALLTLERLRPRRPTSPTPCRTHPGASTGLLEDQVHAAAAALDAYEVTGEASWLALGRGDHGAGLAGVSGRSPRRPVRYRAQQPGRRSAAHPPQADPGHAHPEPQRRGRRRAAPGSMPSPRTCAGPNGERSSVAAFAGGAAALGLHGAAYLLALDWQLNPPTHLVVTGAAGDSTAEAFHRAALAGFAPRRVVRRLLPESADAPLPPAAPGDAADRVRAARLRLPGARVQSARRVDRRLARDARVAPAAEGLD